MRTNKTYSRPRVLLLVLQSLTKHDMEIKTTSLENFLRIANVQRRDGKLEHDDTTEIELMGSAWRFHFSRGVVEKRSRSVVFHVPFCSAEKTQN